MKAFLSRLFLLPSLAAACVLLHCAAASPRATVLTARGPIVATPVTLPASRADRTCDPKSERFDLPVTSDGPFVRRDLSGIDEAALCELLGRSRETKSDALVILREGRLVATLSYGHEVAPILTMSVTKSIVSLAVGLLLEEEKIPSLDVPLSNYFPEFKNGKRALITLRHILTHTSGIEHQSRAATLEKNPDRVAYVRGLPVLDEPGKKFSYSNEAVTLLAHVIEKAAGRPVDTYLGERLFAPLGIRRVAWQHDSAGSALTPGGLSLSALDLAKIGQLLLQGGSWEGKSIVPKRWIEASTSPASPSMGWTGFLWWVENDGPWFTQSAESLRTFLGDAPLGNKLTTLHGHPFRTRTAYWLEAGSLLDTKEREQLIPFLRDDRAPFVIRPAKPVGYRADGWLGQQLVVLPSLGIVVVRQRREPQGEHVDMERENEQYGFSDLPRLARALLIDEHRDEQSQ